MQELPGIGDKEYSAGKLPWVVLPSAGQPLQKKHGPDCMLLFMWLNFPAALHGHGSILRNHDNKAGPALGRSPFLRILQGVLSGPGGQTFTDATREARSRCVSKR